MCHVARIKIFDYCPVKNSVLFNSKNSINYPRAINAIFTDKKQNSDIAVYNATSL